MIVLAWCAMPAHAYNFWDMEVDSPARWPGNVTDVTVNSVSFPIGASGSTQSAISAAVDHWDDDVIPGSVFGISAGVQSVTITSMHDGLNLVSLMPTDALGGDCGAGGDIAGTDLRIDSFLEWGLPDIEEGDIWFNSGCIFSPTDWYDLFDANRSVSRYDPEQVMLHEVGHLIGLDHEDGLKDQENASINEEYDVATDLGDVLTWTAWPGTMGTRMSGGSAIGDLGFLLRQYQVNEDDREGLRALQYAGSPLPGLSEHDVAAQSYWVPDDQIVAAANGDCGDFLEAAARPSPHTDILALALEEDPTEVYGNCPQSLDDWEEGDLYPVLTVPPAPLELYWGAVFDADFTYLNLGAVDEEVNTRVLLTQTIEPVGSTCPSATCFVLAASTPGVNVNQPFEVTFESLTIPEAPAGLYKVVLEMDPDDLIDERFEDNNQAVWNQEIEVLGELSLCGSCSSPGRPVSATGWAVLSMLLVALRRNR